ncbi:roadblock/LC7 domain-containing protein [Dactylosporangium matsuzakiense]|uniref:Dynein regulation protein LC7 n=1 Tax=Dactylosporangium matsuzakiense TaxID=53360 RepID=A0A9W6NM37_9ACTN|nr:roadblock/LC7 domain-containing protein [Dactylosporangium matsuzakiense]UWZ46832.1 roadblock/LC7 domain-containing protein [Dactylosporangium matsuzakiense]GLL01811.1 dynein regulation protein LC7 [Dactylosporangium matsuzakiense]
MTPTTGLDWLLTTFTTRVDGVRHTVAVSGDGLLVAASNELAPARADQVAAMVAGIVSLAQGLSATTDSGPVERTIVEMGRSLLLVIALGGGDTLASLAALVHPTCDVGQVAYEMSGLVTQVGAALTPSTR